MTPRKQANLNARVEAIAKRVPLVRVPTRLATIYTIARKELRIETLDQQYSDSLDFHDLSVVSIKRALEAAYEAGRNTVAAAAVEISIAEMANDLNRKMRRRP